MTIKTIDIFVVVFAASLMLGGCASQTRWESPEGSNDQMSIDVSDCKSYSRRKADESFNYDTSDDFSVPQGSSASLSYGFKQHDARKLQASLFKSCMQRRGYSPAKYPTESSGSG